MTEIISRFYAHHVRNLQHIDLAPAGGLNIFFGENGQGKTNLLEAIALATSLKPIRSVKSQVELIAFNQSQAAIACSLSDSTIHLTIDSAGKKARLDDKPLRDASKLAERISVVTFTPDDLGLVLGSASLRRRALNQLAAGLFPAYTRTFRQYEQALVERNQLLKAPTVDRSQLAAFSQVMIEHGAAIMAWRNQAIELWQEPFREGVNGVLGADVEGQLKYTPSVQISLQWSELLNASFPQERARKTTLWGPHLDDIEIQVFGQNARQTASRGQARAIVLALKMAHLQVVKRERRLASLLLLDDVIGELDPNNAQRLLWTTQNLGSQTFLTTTDLAAIQSLGFAGQAFKIQSGRITK